MCLRRQKIVSALPSMLWRVATLDGLWRSDQFDMRMQKVQDGVCLQDEGWQSWEDAISYILERISGREAAD